MGKSSTPKQQVTEYLLSVHLGVAYSMDAITGIWVNEKEAWTGRSTTQEDILVSKPDLFGGVKKEGGLNGYVCHLPGAVDQVMPGHLTARWGLTPETSPAFRGLTTLFFVGGGAVVSGQSRAGGLVEQVVDDLDLGQQNAGGGFSWSFNNPIIAQTVWIRGERAPGNGPGSQVILDPAEAMIGPDANPAHMIVDCLTNTSWGMGAPASSIGASFHAASTTLFNESFGLSMKWTRQAKMEDFVGEILDHIQATLFLNPRTGLWDIKLLRDDYDVETLRHITPDNAKLTNFQRRLWGEAGNQVAVTWTNPINEEDETVTSEDLGAINSQGGSPVTISRNFYGIRNRDLAKRVADREVRSSSAPLASAVAEVLREFWDVLPGEVFLLTWPEKNVYNLVVRALSVDTGTPEGGTIRLPLLEDIFALEKPPLASPQQPGWVDPGQPPEPIDAVEIFTLPAYFSASADLQTAAIDLEYPEVLAAVLAYQESPDVRSYELFAEALAPDGSTVYQSHGSKSIVERTVLPAGLPWETESRLDDILVLNRVRAPRVGGFVVLGAGSDAGMEIAQVVSFDEDTREWVLARGVLDTVPRAWGAGTPVWFLNKGLNVVDEVELRSAGETVEFKLLPRTSKGVLPLADADVVSDTMTARPHLPLRPANVKVNDHASGSFNGGAASTLTVTWSTRNRLLEDGQVVRWDAGPVAPEYEQGTVVTVYDQGGVQVYEQWGLWTESELVLQRSWFDRYSSITIEVTSRRRDLDSLQGHRIQVTGLAANPAAALPPTPPEPSPPPSPDPAPAEGAWAATGSMFTLDGGGHVVSAVPAILVAGVRDRPTAVGLIVRYTKASPAAVDWITLPEVALDDQPKQSATTAVAGMTSYTVEVAYRSATNILSEWRSLGTVTTGQVIAQQLEDLTAAYVKAQILAAAAGIAELTELGDQVQNDVAEAIAGVQQAQADLAHQADDILNNSKGILELIMRSIDTHEYLQPLVYDGQTPLKTVVHQEVTDRIDGDTAIVEVVDLIGAVSDDGLAFILNVDTVKLGPTESFSQRLTVINATLGANAAAITSEASARATADSATATQITVINANVASNSAAIVTESTARATADSATASQLVVINANVASNSAAISTEATARATADTAMATEVHLIGAKNGAGTAFIIDTSTAFVGPTESMASRLSSITASLGSNSAAITNEATARATADSVIATELHLLGAQNGLGTAFILDTSKVMVTLTESLATRLSGISSSLGSNSAAISSEATTRASADGALSSSITSLSTTVGGFSSTISTIQSSLNGVSARYGVTLNVNGHVSGFQINSGVGSPSSFIIQADRFAVVHSDGSVLTAPFSIFGGQVHMTSVVVHTLSANSVSTAQLVAGSIVTGHITANNIIQVVRGVLPAAVSVTTSIQWAMTTSMVTSAGYIDVDVDVNINMGGSSIGLTYYLYCDGSLLQPFGNYCFGGHAYNGTSMTVRHKPGAGTHTYELYVFKQSGGGVPTLDAAYITIRDNKTES